MTSPVSTAPSLPWVEYDREHIWHPYAPVPAPVSPIPVVEAEGLYLTLGDGRRVIDGMSSWWAVAHGHRHPHLVEALTRQASTLPHVMFGGLTHEPAAELARRLVEMVNTPVVGFGQQTEPPAPPTSVGTGAAASPAPGSVYNSSPRSATITDTLPNAAHHSNPAPGSVYSSSSSSTTASPAVAGHHLSASLTPLGGFDPPERRTGESRQLSKVFFADSGSVSVEVAIKMALQYQRGNGHPERNRLLTWRSGYHGDTQGPMSVCDPDGGMHALWKGTLTEQLFVEQPPMDPRCEVSVDTAAVNSTPDCAVEADNSPASGISPALDIATGKTPAAPDNSPASDNSAALTAYLASIEATLESPLGRTVAAIIVEPIVQGAGGMRFHDPRLVRGLRALANRHDILLILDEIATGFGRSGELFACHEAGITPDIMCVGKALTGGMMSFAAVLATDEVAAMLSRPEGGGALMHGPTFMGNPLACAVSLAACDLIASNYWRAQVDNIEASLRKHLAGVAVDPKVASVRVRGAIGVVETHRPVDMAAATAACVEAGVWLRPFGKLVYAMPPFPCEEHDIAAISAALTAVVEAAG